MTNRKKLVLGVGAAAVAVLGLGAAGAVAAANLLSADGERKAIIDDAARQLGVEPQALSEALKQALKNRVDEAVTAGRLTEEQGDELKRRIDSDEYPRLFGRGFHVAPGLLDRPGLFGHHVRIEFLGVAASYLGISEAELREALQSNSLAEIAKGQGKSVDGLVKALVAEQQKRIDRAVADGRITKQQASELKAKLTEHAEALVNGEFRGLRHDWHGAPGRGSFAPRGPPALFGPIA